MTMPAFQLLLENCCRQRYCGRFRIQEVSEVLVKSIGVVIVSNGMMQIEITPHERQVLLRGLRYVRSSLMLELREPEKDDIRSRSMDLDEVQMLWQRLESSDTQLAAGL